MATYPASRSAASNRSNSGLIASARVSFSRNSQIVRASGTRSDRPNPRNRMNDRRSLKKLALSRLVSNWESAFQHEAFVEPRGAHGASTALVLALSAGPILSRRLAQCASLSSPLPRP